MLTGLGRPVAWTDLLVFMLEEIFMLTGLGQPVAGADMWIFMLGEVFMLKDVVVSACSDMGSTYSLWYTREDGCMG